MVAREVIKIRLLFVHSDPLKEDEDGNFYTGGSYNKEVWNRYLEICDELSYISRKEHNIYNVTEAKEKFNDFDNNRINFIEIPSTTSSIKDYLNIFNRIERNRIIKNEVFQHDAVIARLPSKSGSIAIKYAKLLNKPYLVEVVGSAWDALWTHSFKGKVLALFSHLRTKRGIKNAPYVIYVTTNYLQTNYPTTGQHTNCSNVSLSKFDDKVLDERLNKIKNMSKNNKIIIGTTGAINIKYKGQEYVIKAIGKFKDQGITKFEYQLVGGGDLEYLKSIAKKYNVLEQVKFLGEKPHNEVIEWLDTIDLYIQPSLTEGLPRALIEALSRGLPSIGSNAGGIPELLDEKVIFEKKSISELFNLLSTIDSNFMREQAIRNFNEAKKYDKQIIERRRLEFFNKFKNEMLER